jgi:hypothetical protein
MNQENPLFVKNTEREKEKVETWWRFHRTAVRASTMPWTLSSWHTRSGASPSIADELITLSLSLSLFSFPPIILSPIYIRINYLNCKNN